MENQDQDNILNTRDLSKDNKLKRYIKDDKNDQDDLEIEACSSTKKRNSGVFNSKICSTKNGLPDSDSSKPLTSREKEIEFLDKFLTDHLEKEESASLYISGPTGTGKTASLSHVLQLQKFQEGFKQVHINCMIMSPTIYMRICKELQLPGNTEKACLNSIDKYLKNKHKMILLVLDEIDQLESKHQTVLYTIFEWPALAGSQLVLIGIANAMDLTERTLPRLHACCSLRPQFLYFLPYTKDQIIKIFTTVFASEDMTTLFTPVALQMLAAKIAAGSGDIRKALDIGRQAIELARRSTFTETKSVDTMLNDSTVTVELKHVLEVLNKVYGSRSMQLYKGIPIQQKLILCTMILMLTKGKNKDIVMGKLHDIYKRVAAGRNIDPLDLSEMAGACDLLESTGAVRVIGADSARRRRLRLQWDEDELIAALRDTPLMSSILNNTSCLKDCW